ncbi:MAG TPA: Ig domain-containing protein [Verrucomicrobiae bacterium]|nr:Ig domain-containing protein [Verrucomicrobiae bacterium]
MKKPSFNRGLPLVLAALLAITGGLRTLADHPPDTIFQTFGYVLDAEGNPVVGVDVVGDDWIGETYPSTTDSNGYYSVIFPAEGNYRIQVNCSQLLQQGYACLPYEAVSPEADPVRHDFIVSAATPLLRITNDALPKAHVGAAYHAQLGAADGQPPYTWQLTHDSPALPPGLSLSAGGVISGSPTTNSLFPIKVQVSDANSVITNKVLFITVNRQPTLLQPIWRTNRFSMRLFAAAGQNYTIQMSTNPSTAGWTSLLVTNNPNSGSYIVFDPHATNANRVYRVVIGPD